MRELDRESQESWFLRMVKEVSKTRFQQVKNNTNKKLLIIVFSNDDKRKLMYELKLSATIIYLDFED